ncbi:branched-chain amino acid transport system II carrier protein [Robbsia andropogonis]|uniref:branched-chain amino acid transport system II carrier protein n=1 Tax=Robbsia andropogonis TaxID=28092 RepID=UPI003D23FDC1
MSPAPQSVLASWIASFARGLQNNRSPYCDRTIYPPCIILVVMSFTLHRTRTPSRVLWPVMFVTTVMGCLDGLHSANLTMPVLSHWARSLPFAQAGLGWLLPGLTVWALAWVYDGVAGHTRPVRDQV